MIALLLAACRKGGDDSEPEVLPPRVEIADISPDTPDAPSRPALAAGDGVVALAWQEGTPPFVKIGTWDGEAWAIGAVVGEEALGAWNPSVVIAGGEPLAAWQDYRAGDADLYASTPTGTPLRLDAGDPGAYNSVLPALVAGPDGRIAAVWTDNREDDLLLLYQAWTSLYASVSVDGGATWSEGRIDTGPFTEALSAQPSADWDDAGSLFVAWVDGRGDPFGLQVNASVDDGATFGAADLQVSAGPALHPAIAAWGEGQVAVAWEDHADVVPHVLFAASADGAATFSPAARLDAGAGPARDPVVLADDELVVVAWADGSAGAPDVHVAIATDGVNFVEQTLGDDTPGAAASTAPVLARPGPDTIAIAWLDARDGAFTPTLAISFDDGATFQEHTLPSGDAATLSMVVLAEDELVLGWRESPATGIARVRASLVTW